MKLFPFIFLLTIPACALRANRDIVVELRDASTLKPLADAHLKLEFRKAGFDLSPDPGMVKAQDYTDADGKASFQFMPESMWDVEIDAAGYDLQRGYIAFKETFLQPKDWEAAELMRLHPFEPDKKIEYRIRFSKAVKQ